MSEEQAKYTAGIIIKPGVSGVGRATEQPVKLTDEPINYLASFPVPCETIEKVTELYEFLQGRNETDITPESIPNLSSEQAFSVIYFLQEHMGLITDYIERCPTCKDLYDSASEGKFPHCDACRRD